jgi:hypothetical protein
MSAGSGNSRGNISGTESTSGRGLREAFFFGARIPMPQMRRRKNMWPRLGSFWWVRKNSGEGTS